MQQRRAGPRPCPTGSASSRGAGRRSIEDHAAAERRGRAETSIEATGNISRGIAIFCTSALLRTIDRVPALNVSLKKWTMISPQKMWIAKFSTSSLQPEMQADHEVVDEELRQRVDVGPEQAEERALVARARSRAVPAAGAGSGAGRPRAGRWCAGGCAAGVRQVVRRRAAAGGRRQSSRRLPPSRVEGLLPRLRRGDSAEPARYSSASRGHSRRSRSVDLHGPLAAGRGSAPGRAGRARPRCRRSSRRRRSRSGPAGTTWRPSRGPRPRGTPRRARAACAAAGSAQQAGGDQLRTLAGDLGAVLALARRLRAADRRERVGVGLELGVGELLAISALTSASLVGRSRAAAPARPARPRAPGAAARRWSTASTPGA